MSECRCSMRFDSMEGAFSSSAAQPGWGPPRPSSPCGAAIAFISSAAGLGWESSFEELGQLLATPDFESAVRLAVNHGGDSDSTGAIAGNLLGASLGEGVIPPRWLEVLELREEILRLAEEL